MNLERRPNSHRTILSYNKIIFYEQKVTWPLLLEYIKTEYKVAKKLNF